MNDLLGDPIPDTPSMTDPLPMRVFKMDDCVWWMARTLEEAKAGYEADCGPDLDLEDARELTDAELDRLHYVDSDERDDPLPDTRRTFREELRRRNVDGARHPEMFASTEY